MGLSFLQADQIISQSTFEEHILFFENVVGELLSVPAMVDRLHTKLEEVDALPYISLLREPVHIPSA